MAKTTPRKSTTHAWTGVFPAITTQMHKDGSLDLESTARHAEVLIKSGISGLVFLGSLGENQSLSCAEKRLVMSEMVKAVKGRVTVVAGVAETSTAEACAFAKDCEAVGTDGFMLMPAMNYKTTDADESMAHLRTVSTRYGRKHLERHFGCPLVLQYTHRHSPLPARG
jgi:4-hydroxy-tetrahydrodipicolinate synthase